MTRPTFRGFTLVELLVVITIIGMLVALLLPAIHSVRERSRQTLCLNNLKQLSLAAISHDTARGQLPYYEQAVMRSRTEAAGIDYDSTQNRFTVVTVSLNQIQNNWALSWATILLPRLERQDVWDSIVQPPDKNTPVLMPPIDVFVCPSDPEVQALAGWPGLTYSANCGAWDWGSKGSMSEFLYPTQARPNVGDVTANGVFFSTSSAGDAISKPPISRISGIKDGTGTTLMFAENIHKSYLTGGLPHLSWLGRTINPLQEQNFGIVWVVPTQGTNPQPGDTIHDQERIGGNEADLLHFDHSIPRFARPASAHGSGANVAFCDGHNQYLRDDIDYVVYVQLMTTNGRKCVDPADHDNKNAANDGLPQRAAVSREGLQLVPSVFGVVAK